MTAPRTDEVTYGFQRTIQKHTGIMPKDQNKDVLQIMVDPKATYAALSSYLNSDNHQPQKFEPPKPQKALAATTQFTIKVDTSQIIEILSNLNKQVKEI